MKKVKKSKIVIGVTLVIVLILVISFMTLTTSKTIKAQLFIENPNVYVNDDLVSQDTDLKQGDIIRTSETGLATVILYESVVISLESNTQITLEKLIKEHPEVSQQSGETWNKFTKLFGVNDYTVTSGNSVASVRGTAFIIKNNTIIVPEGEVGYELDGERFLVSNKAIEKLRGEIIKRDLTPQEKEIIKKRITRNVNILKKLRLKELDKNEKVLSILGNKFGFSREDIKLEFQRADTGESDLRTLRDRAPVKLESTEKVILITDKIKELKTLSEII